MHSLTPILSILLIFSLTSVAEDRHRVTLSREQACAQALLHVEGETRFFSELFAKAQTFDLTVPAEPKAAGLFTADTFHGTILARDDAREGVSVRILAKQPHDFYSTLIDPGNTVLEVSLKSGSVSRNDYAAIAAIQLSYINQHPDKGINTDAVRTRRVKYMGYVLVGMDRWKVIANVHQENVYSEPAADMDLELQWNGKTLWKNKDVVLTWTRQ